MGDAWAQPGQFSLANHPALVDATIAREANARLSLKSSKFEVVIIFFELIISLRLKPVIHPIVCLGSTKFLCLRWKLEQVDLPKIAQKLVSVIEMTLLYAAQYSFVPLRPKFEVKLSTQSADKWICMGK